MEVLSDKGSLMKIGGEKGGERDIERRGEKSNYVERESGASKVNHQPSGSPMDHFYTSLDLLQK